MNDLLEDVLWRVGIVFALIAFATLIFASMGYFAGCKNAEVFNQRHETNYTCSDFMWAGEQIRWEAIIYRD